VGGNFFSPFIVVVKDYYDILGVAASATELEIKRAYRKLAVQYHPDKNPAVEARPRFLEINEAYDVLGDRQKRAAYDARLANPLQEIFTEPVRTHRDPAYRQPRPFRKKEPPASWFLMRDSIKYVIWISRVGIVFTTLFFIDYFLPYRQLEDRIVERRTGRGRSNHAYYILHTARGEQVQVFDAPGANFREDRDIQLGITPIFGSVMTVTNSAGTFDAWVAMYSTLMFFPILLFVNSLLALLYRERMEFCFNLSVTAFVLLIISLILL